MLVVPGFTYVTLSHFITFFLRQAAGAVKVYRLGVPDTNTLTLTNHCLGSGKGNIPPDNLPSAAL